MAVGKAEICAQGRIEEGFDFGDRRLNRRANNMANQMSQRAGQSLPQIFCNRADLQGAYRFFDNGQVTPEAILEPHRQQTIERSRMQQMVAVVQDSSDIDFDYLQDIEGFESMHPHVDRGFRIHPSLVITAQGTPLGILASTNYSRKKSKDTAKHRNSLPIEEKESYRWLLGYRTACELAEAAPNTTVVSIADREGDIYECLAEAENTEINSKAFVLVRSNHNRALDGEDCETTARLEKKLIRSPVIYPARVSLNKGKSNSRTADVCVRACQVTIKAPNTSKKKGLPSVTVNAVMVSEVDPPKGAAALHWVLLTTLPVDTPEQIQLIVRLYSQRWQIEVYFKVLKSGCNIDSPHLQERDRIENFIALAQIVAWRVMLTTYLPREFPDAPCTVLFTEVEWKLAFRGVFKKTRPLPDVTPSLKDAVDLVAMLGGYQKRKIPPGIQTIWRGVVRLIDMVQGFEMSSDLLPSLKLNATQEKDVWNC